MEKIKAIQIIRKTRSFYNTIAREWNTSRFAPAPLKKMLLKDIKPGYKVLDLGCGNGFAVQEVIARGGLYFGLDISSKLIAMAKRKNRAFIKNNGAKFLVGTALKLPYKNNFFNFIFSFAVMHHIPSEELRIKYLSEVRRVLKPGGKAVIVNWNLLSPWANKRFKVGIQLKEKKAGFDPGDVILPWKATGDKVYLRYIHVFTDREMRLLFSAAGFKACKVEYRTREGKNKKNGEEQVMRLKKPPV